MSAFGGVPSPRLCVRNTADACVHSPDELAADEFDFQSWCESLGIPTVDPIPRAPAALDLPAATSALPPTPTLDAPYPSYSATASPELAELGTPSDAFLAFGPTPFGSAVVVAGPSEPLMALDSLFAMGAWEDQAHAGPSRDIVVQVASAEPPEEKTRGGAAKADAPKRSRKSRQLYNGSGFTQNKSRLLDVQATKKTVSPTPLPLDPKLRKREINRIQAEKSRARKRECVEKLDARIVRLEQQIRDAGGEPVP